VERGSGKAGYDPLAGPASDEPMRHINQKTRRRFEEMTLQQLRNATKEFDREFIADTFGPPTMHAKAAIAKAKRRGKSH
jgi:hypothetical protein